MICIVVLQKRIGLIEKKRIQLQITQSKIYLLIKERCGFIYLNNLCFLKWNYMN